MLRLAKRNQRYVKGPAAQVVDRQAIVAALAFLAVAMGKLERRGGRLIQQAKHLKAPNPRRLFGKKALVAVGVGGNSEHRFELLALLRAEVRALAQLPVQRRHRLLKQQLHRQMLAANLNLRMRSGASQRTLQRTNQAPARIILPGDRLPSIQTRVSLHCDGGRKPIPHFAFRGLKVNDREVATVGSRHHNAGRSEVDTNFHLIVILSRALAYTRRESQLWISRYLLLFSLRLNTAAGAISVAGPGGAFVTVYNSPFRRYSRCASS